MAKHQVRHGIQKLLFRFTVVFQSNSSIVTFTDAYVSYVIPKAEYDNSSKSYYVTITICLIIPKPTAIDVTIVTNLPGTTIPAVRKVLAKSIQEQNSN